VAFHQSKTDQMRSEAIAVNAIVFFVVYLILHYLTSDEFSEKYENLVIAFAILRILIGFGVILPEKEAAQMGNRREAPCRPPIYYAHRVFRGAKTRAL
jgi:hypothetical protein